ncbi:uncharacterized protein LOC109825174 isoform X2 [Asparagus officinalis]|uniref:uncharacterized protein LOC109825174 isoform X2 n=1 Tax=Asparagus officinalis TaxID=4686 RepID=UPI00098E7131|nr:uncharacterized protein LOC109825174 isoform X2 [Asparagus officinalis]
MRDPFDTQPNLVQSSRHSPGEFAPPATAAMQPGTVFTVGNGDAGFWNPSSDSSIRHHLQRESDRKDRIEENNLAMDPELTELQTRSRLQEEEIMMLRKQIADACEQELQLLKEKHVLERRLSDLRMALDEKQEDAIEDVLKDLSHRKVCIQKNMRLAHDLQVAEEEAYVFTSSLLSLLAEYNIRLPLLNASAITSSTKRLYQNLDWKIRSFDASLDQGQRLLGNQPGDLIANIDRQPPKFSQIQLSQPHLDSGMRNLHQYNHHPVNLHVESAPDQSRLTGNYDMMDMKGVKAGTNPDLQYREFPSNTYRGPGGNAVPNFREDSNSDAVNRREAAEPQFYIPTPHEGQTSPGSEGEVSLPGIEGFQIIGDAKPGNTLRACGFPTNGTSLCIFQWVRHFENGTRQSIEGATVPDYVVTADDVDTFLAVDCTPMDDSGRQGELVRLFANNQNKITCGPDYTLCIHIYFILSEEATVIKKNVNSVWVGGWVEVGGCLLDYKMKPILTCSTRLALLFLQGEQYLQFSC